LESDWTLSDDAACDRIEVKWPGGMKEMFPGGKANTIVTLIQGKGTGAKLAEQGRLQPVRGKG
jgi:hypothetical protein